jgi:hypothetical protein
MVQHQLSVLRSSTQHSSLLGHALLLVSILFVSKRCINVRKTTGNFAFSAGTTGAAPSFLPVVATQCCLAL